MDATLHITRGKGSRAKRTQAYRAWTNNYCNSDLTCPYCPHDHSYHVVSAGQPHFYDNNGHKKIVARNSEIIDAFCLECANHIGTGQVLCYTRTTAIGERLPKPIISNP